MHPLVNLAKETVEHYIRTGRIREIREEELTPELQQQAGVFVSLKIGGMLRGCIGTFQPQEPTIAHETVRNAISAATHDPRFPRVREEELQSIKYSVDVLTPPEPIKDKRELNPRQYGVIVQAGKKRGLLLPDLEGVDTVDVQVNIAMKKAGIAPGTPVDLFRFEVRRYQDKKDTA